jgi:hypothetical protein
MVFFSVKRVFASGHRMLGLVLLAQARLLSARYTTDNSHIEFFDDSLWSAYLNMNWFMSLDDARDKVERW